ncbi:MAG: aconitase X catalytic domain-containing protein [Candidatus Bathyarchaeota archaeon]|nr:aconitase X catalytic domain-containing protein [Candidatus Bathyarchaeota archaeon]
MKKRKIPSITKRESKTLYLTTEEENILNRESGEAAATAMRLLVTMGEIFDADRLIPIKSAQISGISYKTIGDAGLEFIQDFSRLGAKTSVYASINPAGMDLDHWKEIGIPEDFAINQKKIISALNKIGVESTCTCTPYLLERIPKYGDHLAWAESSAVIYANSVLGAMTNREGGPIALASAIIGKTPLYGFHIKNNRRSTLSIDVQCELKNELDFSLLGFYIGKKASGEIPLIHLPTSLINNTCLKALGAAMATSGGQAIYHIKDITPESKDFKEDKLKEKITVERYELNKTKESLSQELDPDIVFIGCPHCSIEEIEEISKISRGTRLVKKLHVCTSRHVWKTANSKGYIDEIEKAGGRVVKDTCMVVTPLERMGISRVLTNSSKAANYLPTLCKSKVYLRDLKGCMKYAIDGN